MGQKVTTHGDLEVYQLAFAAAMRIFELTKSFPAEERYSLIDQIRRASRSVCMNVGEGWRRRRYELVFANKLNEAEGEGAETQVAIEFSVRCGYMTREDGRELYAEYNRIIAKLVRMINNPD